MRSALSDAQYQSHPPEVVCFFQMDFDYNLLTFRPTKHPDLMPASVLPGLVGHKEAYAVLEKC